MAESIGVYDYEFIEVLPDDLTCTLCHFAYKHPVQIEDCGHTFCKECFNQMKDHAVANFLDLCCPLDRQKIDVARVFNVKSEERRVLNLMVKCPNFGDKCDWTGELREVLIHETTCCKNDTMFTEAFGMELKQMLNRMKELETKVMTNEQKLVEKDKQIVDQNKQIEDLKKQNEDQNEEIKSLQKHINNNSDVNQDMHIEDQNKKIADQNKEIEDQNIQIKNQKIQMEQLSKQMEDQNKQIKSLQQCETNMIMPCSNSPFQWKFNLDEIKGSERREYSPPFYDFMSSHCFQLGAYFNDNLRICIYRYRGKYDADLGDDIETINTFSFRINVFGKVGKQKKELSIIFKDDPILKHQIRSRGWCSKISNDEINDLTIDGYLNLHCFFNIK